MFKLRFKNDLFYYPNVSKIEEDQISIEYEFYYPNDFDKERFRKYYEEPKNTKNPQNFFYRKHYPIDKIFLFEGKVMSELMNHESLKVCIFGFIF